VASGGMGGFFSVLGATRLTLGPHLPGVSFRTA